jgi:hypothetical protein
VLVDAPVAGDAIEDLQGVAAVGCGAGRGDEEPEEVGDLVRACRDPQSTQGQAGVAHPGVAVVPVAAAADALGQ